MPHANKNFFIAKNLADVFYQIKTFSDLEIVGGCSALSELPDKILSIRNVEELATIDKRERYVEFGPAVTLGQILHLGKAKLPLVFYEALKTIGTPQIRNLGTIGGNICRKDCKGTLFAPLLALDARIEIDTPVETEYIPMMKFSEVPKGWLIEKIRIPMEDWDVAVFRRLGPAHLICDDSASFVFLANTQKGMLANLRIAFAGPFTFRNLDLENRLIGSHLPLPEKSIDDLVENAGKDFDHSASGLHLNPILRQQFLNLVKFSLGQLT